MGAISDSKDIADAVIYLTEARHITGEVLHVDGGMHVRQMVAEVCAGMLWKEGHGQYPSGGSARTLDSLVFLNRACFCFDRSCGRGAPVTRLPDCNAALPAPGSWPGEGRKLTE